MEKSGIMVNGVLGVIICPMNDDQLIYSLKGDSEVDRVVLLSNSFSDRMGEKLRSKGVAFDVMDEQVFISGEVEIDRNQYNVVILTNDLALHSDPKALRECVEHQIEEMQPQVDSFAVYYGLCGNWGWDLTGWAEANGYKPVTVFRGDDGKVCDDCVSIVVGSSTRYLELEKTYTGMFYLTPSIADNWIAFVAAGDIGKQLKSISKDVLDALGITDEKSYMRWMFEIGNYTNILKLYTGWRDRSEFDAEVEGIGKDLNLKPIECGEGWVTADAADAIYLRSKGFLRRDCP